MSGDTCEKCKFFTEYAQRYLNKDFGMCGECFNNAGLVLVDLSYDPATQEEK